MCELFKFSNARFFYLYWIVEKFSNSTCFHQIVSLNLQHKNLGFSVKPQTNGSTLFGKHFLVKNFACQTCLCIWSPRKALLDKHILPVNVYETFQKHFLLGTINTCWLNETKSNIRFVFPGQVMLGEAKLSLTSLDPAKLNWCRTRSNSTSVLLHQNIR